MAEEKARSQGTPCRTIDGRTALVLSETFGFHGIAIFDCLDANHNSKLHVYDDHVFTVLHAPEIGSQCHSTRW